MRKNVVKHRIEITYEQLMLTLKTYHELLDAGLSRNWCGRTLFMVIDIYASQSIRGLPIPVSKAAHGLPKSQCRYEHGTPMSAIITMFIEAYKANKLTKESSLEIAKLWRVAHITLEEDKRLNASGLRSKAMNLPHERWSQVGIEF
jgi:hypothetical protein